MRPDPHGDEPLRARLRATVPTARPEQFVPHAPHPKQAEFLSLDCLEALYGGAAGGGKTDALLMAALQYIHVPGYAALLLRRTYADLSLPGAIMDRAKDWLLPKGIDWDDKTKRFTFQSGASLTFGYLDTEQDRFRYQGAELQFIGFDELTQFPERWYRYLLSRLRRLQGQAVPLRARAASNPGGIGHDWVRERFVDRPGGDAGESGVRGAPPAFVPATLEDNPHLDRDAYRGALARLDPITRKQLAEGVWIRDGSGLVYGHFDELRNLGAPPTDRDGKARLTHLILGLDFGIRDQNAATVLGWREQDTTVYVLESYRKTATVNEMADEVRQLERRYRFDQIVGDTGGMGKAFAEEMLQRHIPVEAAEKNNKVGYIALLNGDLAAGRIRVDPKRCGDLLDEWRKLPWNEQHSKEAEGFDNHASDATLYAWRAAYAFSQQRIDEKPKTIEEYWAREERREQDADWGRYGRAPQNAAICPGPGWHDGKTYGGDMATSEEEWGST